MEETTQGIRYFNERQVALGSFIGGPLATGYLLAQNYKRMGEEDSYRKALYGGIGCFLLLSALLYFIPESVWDKIPNRILPLINLLIAAIIYRYFQKKKLDQFIENGSKRESYWKTTGIGVLSFVTIMIILIPIVLFKPSYDGEIKSFGKGENLVYYDKSIPGKDIDKIGKVLTQSGFFDDEGGVEVQVREENEKGTYSIILIVDKEYWDDKDAILFFKELDKTTEEELPGRKINIKLYMPGLSGEGETKVVI